MKKYIVTEEQWRLIVEGMHPDYAAIAAEIYALKPIEPLSDKDLSDLYTKATSYSLRNQDKFLAFSFGRAIEAHTIGDGQ